MTFEEMVEKARKTVKKACKGTFQEDFAVEIDITGEGEGAFYVACRNGVLTAEPYEYYDHDCRIRANAYVVSNLLEGNLDIFDAMNDGEINLEGNADKAILLVNAVRPA